MKLNELITSFTIYMTNEEAALLETIDRPMPWISFNERDKFLLDNLIKKSLVCKVRANGQVLVIKND